MGRLSRFRGGHVAEASAARAAHSRGAVSAAPFPLALVAPRWQLCPAVVIPGNSVAESVTVTGVSNFLTIYSDLIIARIFLSWFPGLQGQPFLRPLYTICDPFLNALRGVIPPIFGLDLSPILGITLLQAMTNATMALGAEMPRAGPRRAGLRVKGRSEK